MLQRMLRIWSASIDSRRTKTGLVTIKKHVNLVLEKLEDRLTLNGSVGAGTVTHPSGPDVWIFPGLQQGSSGGSQNSGTGTTTGSSGSSDSGSGSGPSTGTGVGDWNVASNWSLGVVPDSTNQAVFDPTLGSNLGCYCNTSPTVDQLEVTHGYSNTITLNYGIIINNGGEITSGTIDQPSPSTIDLVAGNFTIANCTINSTSTDADMTVNQGMNVTVGGIPGTGGASGDDFNNAGTITFETLGNGNFTFTNNNVITNQTTGVIFLQAGNIVSSSANGSLVNYGSVEKTTSSDATMKCLPIQNVGTGASLKVDSGTLALQSLPAATVSFYQSEGSVTLGSTSASGTPTSGTLGVPQGFDMTAGVLSTLSIDDSKIDGSATIAGGSVAVRADSATATGNLIITNNLTMTGGDFLSKVNTTTNSADTIKVWGIASISSSAIINPTLTVGVPAYDQAFTFLTAASVSGDFTLGSSDWITPSVTSTSYLQFLFTGT